MPNKKIILIPAYEPDNNLITLVQDLSKEELDVLIVDDGSGQNYQEIFNKCQKYAKVISYEENRGKGYALKTGLKYIKEKYSSPYIVVTMDSDGQHTIKDAKKLIREVNDNDQILVLGKRIRSGKTPLRSRLGNNITRFVYRNVTGLDIYDTQTGLRAFSDKLITYLIDIPGERFEYEMNVLLQCAKDKIKIKEIKIDTIYINNNSGSHFDGIKDSYRIYKNIIKFSLTRNREEK